MGIELKYELGTTLDSEDGSLSINYLKVLLSNCYPVFITVYPHESSPLFATISAYDGCYNIILFLLSRLLNSTRRIY